MTLMHSNIRNLQDRDKPRKRTYAKCSKHEVMSSHSSHPKIKKCRFPPENPDNSGVKCVHNIVKLPHTDTVPRKTADNFIPICDKVAKRPGKRSRANVEYREETPTDEQEQQSGDTECQGKCRTDTSVSAGNTCRTQPITKLGDKPMPTSRSISNPRVLPTLQGIMICFCHFLTNL